MVVPVVIAAVIILFGLYWAVAPVKRPANAPEGWTPGTRRSLGVGIALGGVILLVLFLVL